MAFLKTPITDMTGGYWTHQNGNRCSDFELNMMECFEAKGLRHGPRLCKDYVDDFMECRFLTKQFQRATEMREQRILDVFQGKKKFSEMYEKTPDHGPYC